MYRVESSSELSLQGRMGPDTGVFAVRCSDQTPLRLGSSSIELQLTRLPTVYGVRGGDEARIAAETSQINHRDRGVCHHDETSSRHSCETAVVLRDRPVPKIFDEVTYHEFSQL